MAYDPFNPIAELGNMYGTQTGIVPTGGTDPNDPNAMLEALLSKLKMMQAPQMRQPSTGQNVLGRLSDALQTYSSMRGGGGAVTPYRTGLQNERMLHTQRAAGVEQQNVNTQNEAVMAMFGGQMRLREAEARRATQRPFKSEFVRDVNGESRRFRQFIGADGQPIPTVDPQTGEMVNEVDLGPAGYAPVIAPGMDEEGAAMLRISKGKGGKATRVTTKGGGRVEPQPPAGFVQDVGGQSGVLAGIPAIMDIFSAAEKSVGGSEGLLNKAQNWSQAKAAGTSGGPFVAPDELINYYTSVKSVLFPLVKSISGATFPIEELKKYESQFPMPGVDSPSVAQHKWEALVQQISRDMEAKYRAAGRAPRAASGPEQTTDQPDAPLSFGQSILKKLREGGPQ